MSHRPSTRIELRDFARHLRSELKTIIDEWAQFSRQSVLDRGALPDHVPQILDEIAAQAERAPGMPDAEAPAAPQEHALQCLRLGFSLEEVVSDYALLRRIILSRLTARMGELGPGIVLINEALDQAMIVAVRAYTEAAAQTLDNERARGDALRLRVDKHKRRGAEESRLREFDEQLMGIVSHDLRNPLNTITLSASLLLRRQNLDSRTGAVLRSILNAADRSKRMILDLLDFTQARLGGGIPVERESLNIHALVQQVAEDLRLSWPEHELTLEASGEGRGEWDSDRLAQAITNLVTNALTYSSPDTAVHVATYGEDGAVVLTVHNEGEPIPPEMLPELFEPMHRGHPQRRCEKASRSIGLGLFIVRHIVEAHGGTIAVHSAEDEGTTFSVTLSRKEV